MFWTELLNTKSFYIEPKIKKILLKEQFYWIIFQQENEQNRWKMNQNEKEQNKFF